MSDASETDGTGEAPAGRGSFGTRLGFILAAAGSAVGLGNIWKFPYITGENGGGLFVVIYLACIALVGIPIMAAELMIGRAAQTQPVGAFGRLLGRSTGWSIVGWLGMVAGFIILSYYIVVAGWSLDYTLKSFSNFTEPVATEALAEAKAYRATTSVDTMRTTLVDWKADHQARSEVASIRSQAPKRVWDAHGSFTAALAKAGGEGAESARAVLLEDRDFKAAVETAEPLVAHIARAKADARTEATAYYGARSDLQVRDEAETVFRRGVIADRVGAAFGKVVTDGWTATFWAFLFMLMTILIVAGGVSKGIEAACRVLMPLLIGLMVVMVVYGMTQPGFGDAAAFVFSPDPSRLKASGVLEALGHAFFTLSLGMGAMITYGSYQRGKGSIFRESFWIAGLDTGVALLACLMLFPIIFSYGQEPAAGPGLVFKSMPLAFAEMGSGGMLLGIMFFGLLALAALTSAISLLEVVASYFIDNRGWSRTKAAWLLGTGVFLFGIPSAFSFDPDFAMESWESTFGKSFFDTMDYLASNWLLPLGGLLVAIYAGWVLPVRIRAAQLESEGAAKIQVWLAAIRFVAPVLVILVLLQKVGVLRIDELF